MGQGFSLLNRVKEFVNDVHMGQLFHVYHHYAASEEQQKRKRERKVTQREKETEGEK